MAPRDFAAALVERAERIEAGEILSGEDLAHILSELTGLEVKEGGPYAALRGGAPDLGMNLSVARFLSACGAEVPSVDVYLLAALKKKPLISEVLSLPEIKRLVSAYRAKTKAALPEPWSPAETRALAAVRAAAQRRFQDLDEPFGASALDTVERIIARNPDRQMPLMPHYTGEALGGRFRLSEEEVGRLGFANVCFWAAFVIYDDFWDEDEAAEPSILPVANLLARHYIDYFSRLLPQNSGFRNFFHAHMDKLDAANAWETRSCRMRKEGAELTLPKQLPQYGDFSVKFYPAAGHIMSSVAMLIARGYPAASAEIESLVSYFRHYLIAMQINDDAHDWKEDLMRGHISTAVFLLLQEWRRAYPRRTTIDVVRDMSALEQLFWFKVLPPLCRMTLMHTERSRHSLAALDFLENPAPLARFIDRNERVAESALAEHRQSEAFLAAFHR